MPPIAIQIGSALIGSALGWTYYKLIGCRSGVCPIISTPLGSILVGAVAGFFIAGSLT